MPMEPYSSFDFFKVSGGWSCDAGRRPVSKVKRTSHAWGLSHICRFELYHAGEIEIYVLQTTLFSVLSHSVEEAPTSSFVGGYLQAERSVAITMSCRSGLSHFR